MERELDEMEKKERAIFYLFFPKIFSFSPTFLLTSEKERRVEQVLAPALSSSFLLPPFGPVRKERTERL